MTLGGTYFAPADVMQLHGGVWSKRYAPATVSDRWDIAVSAHTETETVHVRDVEVSRNSTVGIATFDGTARYYAVIENSVIVGNGGNVCFDHMPCP